MISIPLALLCCASFDYTAASPVLASRGAVSDNPTAANFLRRAWHGSVVIGDFVFIDGGEISQLVNGIADPGQGGVPGGYTPGSRQNNITLSIDLRNSWTNSSLVVGAISKGSVPVLNGEEFWIDPDGQSFYLWNGELSWLTKTYATTPDSLWKFTSDGTGSGTWSQQSINYTAPSSATSQSLLRPGGNGCSTTIGDVGYYVGGRVWKQSDMDASPTGYFQNTITTFNMSSGIWNNELKTSIGSSGTIEGASIGTITAFGLDGRGLIVLIGGRDPGTNVSAPIANYFALSNVTLYDPYIDRWYAQQASGDIPPPREEFCAVTVPGDNGTYEVFIYGGLNQLTSDFYDDVYVLTIPGFVWFKVLSLAPGVRFTHTCEIVGGRQLLVIGGLDNPQEGEDIYYDFTVPDPLTQGIGIFDMTAMVWKSGYDANALPYQTPQIVKEWYSEGNQAKVQWQSLELARMFIRDTAVSVNPTPTATASGFPAVTSTASNDSSDNKSTIIGIVTGLGSFIVALLAALFGLYKHYERKKASKKLPQKSLPKTSPQGTGATDTHSQLIKPLTPKSDKSRNDRIGPASNFRTSVTKARTTENNKPSAAEAESQ